MRQTNLFVLLSFLLIADTLFAKTVLVTGGAGFIGSHVNERLYQCGYDTVVLDNLCNGDRRAVLHGTFIQGSFDDKNLLDHIFNTYQIDAVMHFAAFLEVGESVNLPLKYYLNNVAGTIHLLEAMKKHQVNNFIFSSTCAIFGIPNGAIINENHPCHPINPYGQSKLMIETVLEDLDKVDNFRYCCLRYFNVAGGDPLGNIKNYKKREATLIPVILRSLKNSGASITIFGEDYATPDGTCVRDYVHVDDLASAHILAMEKLFEGAPSTCYNLGSNQGFSVREVVNAVEKVTGFPVNVIVGPRRAGDPASLVADSSKARRELSWEPRFSSIELMIKHAWKAMN